MSRAAERVREAAALGFTRVALPARDAKAGLALPTTAITNVADLSRFSCGRLIGANLMRSVFFR